MEENEELPNNLKDIEKTLLKMFPEKELTLSIAFENFESLLHDRIKVLDELNLVDQKLGFLETRVDDFRGEQR